VNLPGCPDAPEQPGHRQPRANRAHAGRVLFSDRGLIAEEGTPERIFKEPRCDRMRECLRKFTED
jgi:ABC-type histidine transport system ATPase subunit